MSNGLPAWVFFLFFLLFIAVRLLQAKNSLIQPLFIRKVFGISNSTPNAIFLKSLTFGKKPGTTPKKASLLHLCNWTVLKWVLCFAPKCGLPNMRGITASRVWIYWFVPVQPEPVLLPNGRDAGKRW